MDSQLLAIITVIVCSLGGWYVLLSKYFEQKRTLDNLKVNIHKAPENTEDDKRKSKYKNLKIPIPRLPANLKFANEKHIPGMGLPPQQNVPFDPSEEQMQEMIKQGRENMEQITITKSQNKSEQSTINAENPIQKSNQEFRNWGTILHLSGLSVLLGFPFINAIVPAIIWLIKKDNNAYIERQGKEVINFHLAIASMQIMFLLAGVFLFWLIPGVMNNMFAWTKTLRVLFNSAFHLPGNIFTILPVIIGCHFSVKGAIAAYNGFIFKYPNYKNTSIPNNTNTSKSSVEKTNIKPKQPQASRVNFG